MSVTRRALLWLGGRPGAQRIVQRTPLSRSMVRRFVVDATLQVYRRLAASHAPPRLAVQAYLHRTPGDLRSLAELGTPIRLVKGAYSEPEDRALQSQEELSARYRELTDWLFDHHPDP